MAPSAVQLKDLSSAAQQLKSAPWSLAQLAGRLVEISGSSDSASLTLALGLVLESQKQGEPAAWITTTATSFFPPDAAEEGIDVEALIVVRVPAVKAIPRAADRLVRSGGFGLVILDLGPNAEITTPLQARLAGLAKKHHTLVICLTEKTSQSPSLGSLVSIRVQSFREKIDDDRFRCELRVIKDKRRGTTWTYEEVVCGPPGLR
jgi:recombination protein RecA